MWELARDDVGTDAYQVLPVFFIDPTLMAPIPPDITEAAQSSYKTNLGLLVDAMETSDKPGGARNQNQRVPGPNPHLKSSVRGDQAQSQQQSLPQDARMQSLLAASFAATHSANYPGSATPPTPQAEVPVSGGSDKVIRTPLVLTSHRS